MEKGCSCLERPKVMAYLWNMSHEQIIPIKDSIAKNTHINSEQYKKLYQASLQNPEAFWGKVAEERITWDQRWTKVKDTSFKKPVSINGMSMEN